MVHNIDAVLGIYYLGLHLWMAVFGQSATAMRLPSVIAMAAAAAVVALIGQRLGGRLAGLASGLVFAVIPSVTRFAQEAQALRVRDALRGARHPALPAGHGAAALVALGGLRGGARRCGRGQPDRGVRRRRGTCSSSCGTSSSARCAWAATARRTAAGSCPAAAPRRRARRGLLVRRFCVSAVVGAILVSPLVIAGHSQQGWQIGQQPVPHVAQLFGISGGLWIELFASVPAAVVVMLLAIAALCRRAGRAAPRHRRVRAGVRDRPGCRGLAHLARPGLLLDLPLHAVQHHRLGGRRGPRHRLPRRAGQGHPAGAAGRLPVAAVRAGGGSRRRWWASPGSTTSWRCARTRRTTCGPTRRCRRTGSRWTTRRPPPCSRRTSGRETSSPTRWTTRTTTRWTPASPITCAASQCPRRSSRRRHRSRRTACSRPSASTRRSA